jgi:predicted RNase H-like HicB family nuclease
MQREVVLQTVIRKECRGGYSVHCPSLGIPSQGDTPEEAQKNIKEAVTLHLETARDSKDLWSEALERPGVTPAMLKRRACRLERVLRVTDCRSVAGIAALTTEVTP